MQPVDLTKSVHDSGAHQIVGLAGDWPAFWMCSCQVGRSGARVPGISVTVARRGGDGQRLAPECGQASTPSYRAWRVGSRVSPGLRLPPCGNRSGVPTSRDVRPGLPCSMNQSGAHARRQCPGRARLAAAPHPRPISTGAPTVRVFGGDEVARIRRSICAGGTAPSTPDWCGERVRNLLGEVNTGIAPPTEAPETALVALEVATPLLARRGPCAVAPFTDADLARFGQHLPMWRRAKLLPHRRLAARACPKRW